MIFEWPLKTGFTVWTVIMILEPICHAVAHVWRRIEKYVVKCSNFLEKCPPINLSYQNHLKIQDTVSTCIEVMNRCSDSTD